MLTYHLENRGNTPCYQFLYECLKQDILTKKLTVGTKLPSKRSLAKNLGVSVMTVENSYAQLLLEGYLYAIEKSGYYVSDIKEQFPLNTAALPVHLPEPEPQKMTFLANFSSNRTDPAHFPFSIWSRLMRQTLATNQQELLEAPSPQGLLSLREAIASHLYQFRGMQVLPEQIIVGAGTEYLYNLLIQLLGRDLIYSVEDPGYQKLSEIYRSNNVTCRHLRLDSSGIDMEQLRKSDVNIIHTSPAHHFPTGIIMPITRRHELLAWANSGKMRCIIEDDYDCEFRFTGQRIPALQSIDTDGRVIYMNTFSKTLASSIRISYMVLPLSLLTAFRRQLGFYSCTVSSFDQTTLAAFLQDGYFEKHINRMRTIYRTRRDAVISAMKASRLGPYITILEEDAGLHFLVRIDTPLSDADLIARALASHIQLTCLSDYSYHKDPDCEHIFIINYSALQLDTLPQALDILADIITEQPISFCLK